jgi:outer membrane murein-binding lipoprotein Lpp
MSGETLDEQLVAADVSLLLGTFFHLKYRLVKSKDMYTACLSWCASIEETHGTSREVLIIAFEAKQKMAQLASETGELSHMQEQLDAVSEELAQRLEAAGKVDGLDKVLTVLIAWTRVLKTAFWTAKADAKQNPGRSYDCDVDEVGMSIVFA